MGCGASNEAAVETPRKSCRKAGRCHSETPPPRRPSTVTLTASEEAAAELRKTELFSGVHFDELGEILEPLSHPGWRLPETLAAQVALCDAVRHGLGHSFGALLDETPPRSADAAPPHTAPSFSQTLSHACGLSRVEFGTALSHLGSVIDAVVDSAVAEGPWARGAAVHEDRSYRIHAKAGVEALVSAAAWAQVESRFAVPATPTGDSDTLLEVFGWLPHSARRAVGVLRHCTATAVAFALLVTGGRRGAAGTLDFTSTAVSRLVTQFTEHCAHPARGMESAFEVEGEVAVLASVLALVGAVPPTRIGGAFEDWAQWLPVALLSSQARSTAVYVGCLLLRQQRLNVRGARRQAILEDLVDAARDSKLRGSEPLSSRVFPVFDGEAGEGHGPRKEFFDCCAAALSSPFTHGRDVRGRATVALTEGVAQCALHTVDPSARALFREGQQLLLRAHDEDIEAVIVELVRRDAALHLRIDTLPPRSCPDAAVLFVRDPQPALLSPPSPDASRVWFSEAVADATLGGDALVASGPLGSVPWVHNRAWLAGWLAGTALCNGVGFPLPLPCAFFAALRQHCAGAGSLEAGSLEALEADLFEIDPSFKDTAQRVHSMDAATLAAYEDAVDSEDDDVPAPPDAIAPRRAWYVREHLVRRVLVRQCRQRLRTAAAGFAASLVPSVAFFPQLSPRDLQGMVCGHLDDGEQDFQFRSHFNVVFDEDLSQFEHSRQFQTCVADVFAAAHLPAAARAPFKRQLLRFITGRTFLPPYPMSETITVSNASPCMTSVEYGLASRRLPAAHTCSNTLELPHYLECALLAPGGAVAAAAGLAPRGFVDDSLREGAWGRLTSDEQRYALRDAGAALVAKITAAVGNADSYELDEIVVPRHASESRSPAKSEGFGAEGGHSAAEVVLSSRGSFNQSFNQSDYEEPCDDGLRGTAALRTSGSHRRVLPPRVTHASAFASDSD